MGIVERLRILLETRKHKKYEAGKELDRHGYRLVTCVNRGRFGATYLAEAKATGRTVAIKMTEESDCMVGEKHLWKNIHHHNCVNLFERFNVKGYDHFVCEYAHYGDIMSWLEKSGQPLGPHLEAFARQITRCVLLAFDHCHEHDLAHLDFKWANVLLDDTFTAKLTGFSYMCSKADSQGICLGDPLYHPPEALTTGVSREAMDKVDIWMLGAALVHLLAGWYIPVLNVRPDNKMLDMALAVDIPTESVHLPRRLAHSGLSEDVQDFLVCLLKYRPEERPSARKALEHPWFTGHHLEDTES